jgi:hypothetical protein
MHYRADVLSRLGDCAYVYPQLRLMQIVFNALDMHEKARLPDGTPRDVFYVTDEELAAALSDYAEQALP